MELDLTLREKLEWRLGRSLTPIEVTKVGYKLNKEINKIIKKLTTNPTSSKSSELSENTSGVFRKLSCGCVVGSYEPEPRKPIIIIKKGDNCNNLLHIVGRSYSSIKQEQDKLRLADIVKKYEKEFEDVVVEAMKKDKDIPYGNFNIQELGPEAKTIENDKGGKQSAMPYRFDCLPPLALARVAKVLAEGANKYGANNWTNISNVHEHTGRAMGHINAFHAGDLQEGDDPSEHLAHSLCRLMFALDLIERSRQESKLEENETEENLAKD